MKKASLFITIALILFLCLLPLSGCGKFQPPPSKMAENKIDIFASSSNNKFNQYGFKAAELSLNWDGSGHIYFFIENSKVDEKINSINTAIDEINQRAYETSGNYQAGYRLVWVRPENIRQEGDDVAVVVEFADINYFRSDDVKLRPLSDYLIDTSSEIIANNNFIDAASKEKRSIVSIENKDAYMVLSLKNVPGHIPVKVGGLVSAYYIEDLAEGDIVEVSKDSIWSSRPIYTVLIRQRETSRVLMIIAILFGVSFVASLTVKLLIDNSRRKRKIEIQRHTSKSK